jgi:dolichyl-phosphate-mannose-protein mannosyltransferase
VTVSLLHHRFLEREAALAWSVVAISVAVNVALLVVTGVRAGADTVRYIDGAANLLARQPLVGMQALFPGYIALVAASNAIGWGTGGVVLVQIAAAAAATAVLFQLGARLSNAVGGTIAALLFAVNVDIARWHLYVLTDSLYISFVVIATWVIDVAAERGRWRYVTATAIVLGAATLRPHGRVLPIAAALYWTVRRPAGRAEMWTAYAAAATMIVVVAATAAATLRAEAETPARWLRDGVVIWSDDASRVAMPRDAAVGLSASAATSADPLRYALRHPIATLRLASMRVGVELLHGRRFYSAAHNLVAVTWMCATYVLACVGYLRVRGHALARLIALVVALHLLFIASTFADWDGRFVLYVLPLITVFAAAGLAVRGRASPTAAIA